MTETGSQTGSGASILDASSLAVVLVHYRTPELLVESVTALRRDTAQSGIDIEIVVVDNGNDDRGRARFAGLDLRVIEPERNLGYAGGVNLGVRETSAPLVVAMNPDVLVEDGCLAGLLHALREHSIAGPRMFWDRGRRLLLPPADERTPAAEIVTALSGRSAAWARRARVRWRRRARRHWQATELLLSFELSGALLAFRRDAFERVGPFDEGFPLYFEETDWLGRAARAGLSSVHVPAARAVHLYDQSASKSPERDRWYAESAARFRRGRYGRAMAALLARLERGPLEREPLELGEARSSWNGSLPPAADGRSGLWFEVSPNPRGLPAAAERAATTAEAASWQLPAEIRECHRDQALWLRICDDHGRELAVHRLGAVAEPS